MVLGTTDIPSDQITIKSGSTVAVSAAFSTTKGLVGGMDTATGSATPGEVVAIESSDDAATEFGDESELKAQVDLALANDAGTIYATPVSETQTTESFAASGSGTVSNTPVVDPRVNTEHDITAQDTVDATSVTVNEVDESPPSTPSNADTINFNPTTGEWDADSSSDYDITYTYGDYAGAITATLKKVPRFVTVLTENTSVANDLLTNLNTYANDFDFMHGVVGAMPDVTASEYTDNIDDRRLIIVAPSRAYTDVANTEMVRTMGAVGGKQAGQALGDSTTFEPLNGFADLNTSYTNSQLGTLIDNQVLPLKQGGGVKIVKDMTTSTDTKFERIYASEITDESAELSHGISQQFIGESNTESNRFALSESHASTYAEMESDDLLDAYSVKAEEGPNANEVDLTIGLDIVDVMDTIDVSITVGDVITNEGAS